MTTKDIDNISDDGFAQEYYYNHQKEYIDRLLGVNNPLKLFLTTRDISKLKEAYDKAHDIRKFEIELYWKRTTYIWTVISALVTISGLLLSQSFKGSSSTPAANDDVFFNLYYGILFLSSIGTLITIIAANILKSSVYWQKNWEYHTSLLEPLFSGSIYSTHLNSNFKVNKNRKLSISKINTCFYLLMLFCWLAIFEASVFIHNINYTPLAFPIILSFVVFVGSFEFGMQYICRSKDGDHHVLLNHYNVTIINEKPKEVNIVIRHLKRAATFILALGAVLLWLAAILVIIHYSSKFFVWLNLPI